MANSLYEMAKTADSIQNASNIRGLMHTFRGSVLCDLGLACGVKPADRLEHCIVRAWVDKFSSLARVQGDDISAECAPGGKYFGMHRLVGEARYDYFVHLLESLNVLMEKLYALNTDAVAQNNVVKEYIREMMYLCGLTTFNASFNALDAVDAIIKKGEGG